MRARPESGRVGDDAQVAESTAAARAVDSHRVGGLLSESRRPIEATADAGSEVRPVGRWRAVPERMDRREEHRADVCAGGERTRCPETRTRDVATFPKTLRHRSPNTRFVATGAHSAVAKSSRASATRGPVVRWAIACWFGRHSCSTVWGHTRSQITGGSSGRTSGLRPMWQRLAEHLEPWYEQRPAEGMNSSVLHAAERGWRVNGKTHGLWCYSNPDLTYDLIDRCRGGPTLEMCFTTEFEGILASDFWGAYEGVECALRQTGLVTLLRDLETVKKY